MRYVVVLVLLLLAPHANAAITFFGSAANPAHNGANSTVPVAVSPPASMAANDYVIVIVAMWRTPTATITVSDAGGQTWTSETQLDDSPIRFHTRIFHTRYNGTWSANPSWTVSGGTGGAAIGAVMLVFRGVDTSNATDVGLSQAAGATGASNDYTRTGITTNTSGAMVVALWAIGADSATWTLQTGGWSQDQAGWRNDGGDDYTVSYAYKIVNAAASGDVVNRLSRSASGYSFILALKEAGGGGGGDNVSFFIRRRSP